MRQFNMFLAFVTALLLVSMQHNEACRILDKEEENYWKPKDLALQSLQRGPVPPSGNGCTFIPGQGGRHCTNQMNFAGHDKPPAPPLPVFSDHMIRFSVSHSLQRGPVPPSGNGCTYIPGRGGRHCTNQKNFAGHAKPPPPPAYSDHMIQFGVSQSLQRGPVPPSGNGCTYIPGRGGGRHCTNQMNFAGNVMPPPPVLPDNAIPFGVATDRK